MSSQPFPPVEPTPQVPAELATPVVEVVPPTATLKPLLNPLQNDGPPPSSTIVEPPRSPNPMNGATDGVGNNVETGGSAAVSVVGDAVESTKEPVASSIPVVTVDTVEPLVSNVVVDSQTSLSPLPPTATLPPTPDIRDETPPVLAPDAIPPAVATPTVITIEEPSIDIPPVPPAVEVAPIPDAIPESFPTEGNVAFDSISQSAPFVPNPIVLPTVDAPPPVTDVPNATPATVAVPMDIDADGEEESGAVNGHGLASSASTASLKRSGEDLEGREEKRVKEDGGDIVPIGQPEQLPVTYILPAYTPAAPKYAGPDTPLTPAQHKHLLGAVRNLKRNKIAFAFNAPVDPVALGLPHYPQVITKPMDLATVETKLVASDPKPKDTSKVDFSLGKYDSASEVVRDVRQIWENTRIFNGPTHAVSLNADVLDEQFEKAFAKLPQEPVAPVYIPPPAAPSPVAPSPSPHPRRASVSQPPTIRRSSTGPDAARPKREIHPPPSKDLAYADGPSSGRKIKRRNDVQLKWASKVISSFETVAKYYDAASPFFYPVGEIIKGIPEYSVIIKKPIDLLIIRNKIDEGEYEDVSQVHSDMKLMTNNALKFNPPDHAVHTAALQLQQIWDEKYRTCPPKQEVRAESEDVLGEDFVEDDAGTTDLVNQISALEAKIAEDQARLADLKAKLTKRKASLPKSTKPKAGPSKPRKQSMVGNGSPGTNGNGAPKKPRKSKDLGYDDEEEGVDSEEEATTMTLTQKQELAEKIQVADGGVLQKAIDIIQQTTTLGANNEEIELDIDMLPPRTVLKLYNLVCRGGRKPQRPKPQTAVVHAKKPGRKGTGGVARKSMNEQEEAARIKRMEMQLQSFEGGRGGGGGGQIQGYEGGEGDSESSEEESSDEE